MLFKKLDLKNPEPINNIGPYRVRAAPGGPVLVGYWPISPISPFLVGPTRSIWALPGVCIYIYI